MCHCSEHVWSLKLWFYLAAGFIYTHFVSHLSCFCFSVYEFCLGNALRAALDLVVAVLQIQL